MPETSTDSYKRQLCVVTSGDAQRACEAGCEIGAKLDYRMRELDIGNVFVYWRRGDNALELALNELKDFQSGSWH